MIIENPDLFKSWLTSILEPLCDADPAALAKYVYALVKKDKQLDELREGMLDQLDVFLQHETKPFVDMLFKSLETMEYLKSENKEVSSLPDSDLGKENDGENHLENSVAEPSEESLEDIRRSPVPGAAPKHRVVMTRGARPATAAPATRQPPQEQTLVKVLPLNELLEEPVDQPPRRRDRRGDMLRDKDERRRRRSRSWDRRARPRRPHRENNQEEPRRFEKRRLQSRSPSPRGRYRNRSPPPADRPLSRSRSRSPVPRDRERERPRPLRELERDRMSRDRDHLERVSRSRDRERSRDRSMSPAHVRNDNKDMYKRRCRDFDEQGFCLRGDLCQWDHGADPVVVEDVSRVIPVPEYNPLTPDIWCGAPGYVPYPHHPHPPRELIPIPRIREMGPPAPIPAAPPLRHPPPHKKNFDYNRLGPSRPPVSGLPANCSLEVKKVPRGLNDITHLNNHFGKFGKIVNIQVCFEGDPEAALITFSKPTEASVAYKSTEAVLNNRFIKVFWHNPNNENKQENQPPAQKQNLAPNQHPTSQNKVLINKDNMKATADNNKLMAEKAKEAEIAKEQKKSLVKPATQPSKISLTQVVEARKRAQALLEEQLQQQVLMINKLESGEVPEAQKPPLMEAIQSTQEGIEKLRKQLLAYDNTIKQMQSKRPKTREEAQKEILDAELDMFTKQQEGQDVTALQKKISMLRQQMALQFPTHPVRRPMGRGGRFNPATRYVRAAAPAGKVFVNQSVDHRPTALLISGFESDELDSLITHFSQFGTVTGKEVNLAVPELVLQYAARQHAEQAMLRGKHYNDRTLSITWVTNNKSLSGVGSSNGAPKLSEAQNGKETEQQQELAEDALLRSDEEEEDEAEDERSWRR